RTILTAISISVSLLLLTLMMTVWKAFYIDQGPPESALRLITRHKVSLTNAMPLAYEPKIRAVPGVVAVASMNWFGGKYKDDKPENFFAQFYVEPENIVQVYSDWQIPEDQKQAWFKDRAGCAVGRQLADRLHFKVGDKVHLIGTMLPSVDLTVRAIIDGPEVNEALWFNRKYLDEAVGSWSPNVSGMYSMRVASESDVPKVTHAIDDMFRNSPEPTKTETEKAFQLGFVAMMGNVKAFILGISGAVVFAILLVSGNTMAMSIRERIREVAVLKTIGFTKKRVLTLFVGEAVAVSLLGGIIGVFLANGLIHGMAQSPMGGMFRTAKVDVYTALVALTVAALVGFLSAFLPSYRASNLNIAEGLRHLG
ncbi:MAG TPA: FtsX-like permease family protein, partial [Terriglobales bacterium]|nr:FtsX-like permease family protein [Terriglobales bacterium]